VTGYHTFTGLHPAVLFLYIASAIICAMFTMQPAYVLISFAAGTIYAVYLGGARSWLAGLRPLLVMFVLIALINPLTNHRGATVLFAMGDYPITLQALLYGVCAGGMLMSVFVWFMCYQKLITNDKFMFLFGRAWPTSSMVISMILKFVPVMSVRMREIANAQAALGKVAGGGDISEGGRGAAARRGRISGGARVSSILISRCMEESIETADSMRARGYGTGTRTSLSRYRLRARDIISAVIIAALLAANIFCVFFIGADFRFFPFVSGISPLPFPYILYALMLLWPFIDEAVCRLSYKIRYAN
jgi:energy-coupling factor transport system permease protein